MGLDFLIGEKRHGVDDPPVPSCGHENYWTIDWLEQAPGTDGEGLESQAP